MGSSETEDMKVHHTFEAIFAWPRWPSATPKIFPNRAVHALLADEVNAAILDS